MKNSKYVPEKPYLVCLGVELASDFDNLDSFYYKHDGHKGHYYLTYAKSADDAAASYLSFLISINKARTSPIVETLVYASFISDCMKGDYINIEKFFKNSQIMDLAKATREKHYSMHPEYYISADDGNSIWLDNSKEDEKIFDVAREELQQFALQELLEYTTKNERINYMFEIGKRLIAVIELQKLDTQKVG